MSESEKAARTLGRPRKYPSDIKRPTLTFRIRNGIHERLKTSAASNELSLSEEIERRVALSFDQGGAFGHPETFRLCLDLAHAFQNLERRFGKAPWFEIEPDNFDDEARDAFDQLLRSYRNTLKPWTAEEIRKTNEPLLPELQETISPEDLRSFAWTQPISDDPPEPEPPVMVPLPPQPRPTPAKPKRTRKPKV